LIKSGIKPDLDLVILIKAILDKQLVSKDNIDKIVLHLVKTERLPYIEYNYDEDEYLFHNTKIY
jgi:hypothetical protein